MNEYMHKRGKYYNGYTRKRNEFPHEEAKGRSDANL